jgi:hypothetical protein
LLLLISIFFFLTYPDEASINSFATAWKKIFENDLSIAYDVKQEQETRRKLSRKIFHARSESLLKIIREKLCVSKTTVSLRGGMKAKSAESK